MQITSDLDKINRIVSIFAIIKNNNHALANKSDLNKLHLRPKAVEVISYYILFGVSSSTKDLMQDAGFSRANIHQINSELRKLGYLIKDNKNYHNDFLSPELQRIKDYFLDKTTKEKLFAIKIVE